MMMANPSGAHHQEREAAQPTSYDASSAQSSSSNGNNSVSSALGNSSATQPAPALYDNPEISSDWTAEEQLILEEGLFKYASESNINRYAKIALHFRNKTVRDVALGCRWLVKKEMSKRWKEDNNSVRKSKERKQSAVSWGSLFGKIFVFKQISANLAVHKFHENVCLFCQAQDNILKILDNFRNALETMRNMPPLTPSKNEIMIQPKF